ncbi:hypothetical protein BDA96_01G388200 [Sorghum bicolor]|uniref:Uncharacterized protein n=2 Tax=Sorghum bicolor TaxID=4558 RepID=A0A921V0T8_SORBI|nr:hypothetical protein BDA96_01G388000 [Sorghum bicolor]KAG0551023.1 hypothetical protein BDA96_01G388200 [Sorghum bicolor]KXG39320.1 hypothetical protein SORBI_3001G364300 [Sorghum bicolor]
MLTTMAQGPSTTGEHHAGAAARSSLPLASLTQGPCMVPPSSAVAPPSSSTARAALVPWYGSVRIGNEATNCKSRSMATTPSCCCTLLSCCNSTRCRGDIVSARTLVAAPFHPQ